MGEYEFTLILDGARLLEEDAVDAFFDAGCDDATFGSVDGVVFADFIREGKSAATAILSAVGDVQKVAGVRVRRIEPDTLVTASEIATRLGRSRESVRLWIEGSRGPGNFPPPLSHLKSRTRLWRWVEVEGWLKSFQAVPEDGDALVVAALNDVIDLLWLLPDLPPSERRAVARLLP